MNAQKLLLSKLKETDSTVLSLNLEIVDYSNGQSEKIKVVLPKKHTFDQLWDCFKKIDRYFDGWDVQIHGEIITTGYDVLSFVQTDSGVYYLETVANISFLFNQ